MKIIVGLGNVGEKYLLNRHNAGFLTIDQFAAELEKAGTKAAFKEENKFKAEVAKVPYENEILLLVKPTTLMNRSGEAVSKILNFFKEPISSLTVIYDDIDLPLGTIRVRNQGSAGTHNGMKSIIQSLGNQEFHRIRIGIESRGELTPKQQELHSFVLSDFIPKEHPIIGKSIKEAVKELKNAIST